MMPLSPEAERYIYSNGVMPNRQASMMDFVLKSCQEPLTTPNINRALIHFRQVPTLARVSYLQAKADARAVQPYLGHAFRDFLHSGYTQFGEGGELGYVVDAALAFNETGNRAALDNALQQRRVKNFFSTQAKRDQLADRDAYKIMLDDPITRGLQPVSAIVERIKGYVDLIPVLYSRAPLTSDPKLNKQLETMATQRIDRDVVNNTLEYMNTDLLARIQAGTYGIKPTLIEAMEWMDMKMGSFVYHYPYERQSLAYKEDWYKNVLKYQELTGSAYEFDSAEFETRIEEMRSFSSPRDASLYVMNMTRERQEKLRDMYQKEQVDYLNDIFVYVAGLVDIGLMIPITARHAETVQGERSKAYYSGLAFQAAAGYHHGGD